MIQIISGGQTGVDRAALDIAINLKIKHGGYCTKGRRAEDGVIPLCYQLIELKDTRYIIRTLKNVIASDATMIIYNKKMSGGTAKTLLYCKENNKPSLLINANEYSTIQAAKLLQQFITQQSPSVLNVAGPRASGWPGAYDYSYALLRSCFSH